jgi:signal-transduction protein with cAMP-binding, CBS, and nucleotidyltransferase domain
MMKIQVQQFLETHLPFIKEIKLEDWSALQKSMEIKHFNPGEKVIRAGQVGDGFYVVVKGKVRVFTDFEEQKKNVEVKKKDDWDIIVSCIRAPSEIT